MPETVNLLSSEFEGSSPSLPTIFMNIKYTLKEIYPRVFLVGVTNSYDLAMLFCRAQEFYESCYKEIRGKNFTMTELQRIYSIRRGDGCFTYPNDWVGFNIPCHAMHGCYDIKLKDRNEYDEIMIKIHKSLKKNSKYYIIGSDPESKSTIEHEVAHAFYYLYPKYRNSINDLLETIPKNILKKFKASLLNMGYADKVVKDEIQAYLLTDKDKLVEDEKFSKNDMKIINKTSTKIIQLFSTYK